MAKITKTDYETVKKRETVTVCDVCRQESDNTVLLVADPKVKKKQQYEVVTTYESKEPAEKEVYQSNKMARMAEYDERWAAARKWVPVDRDTGGSVDICRECFGDVFGSTAPDREADVQFDDDGIKWVTEEHNIVKLTSGRLDQIFVITVLLILLCGIVWALI